MKRGTVFMSKYIPTEPLTKENFWDELQKLYPEGLKIFTDWVDGYKESLNWELLFNSVKDPVVIPPAPKYHELPFAFQLGIWLEFAIARGGCSYELDFLEYDLKEEITNYVKLILQREATFENTFGTGPKLNV